MASLRELVQTLLPGARPLVDAREEAMARSVTWVRLLRDRLPAFDGMEPGDLAIVPISTLRSVAADKAARTELVDYLADHDAVGIIAIPGGGESTAAMDEGALNDLAAAARATRLPCLLLEGVETATLERILIGAVVNRRAELERQAVTLERQVAALALDGQGLDALVGALAAFIGRGVALEARGGASLAVVAPAGLPTSAAAASAVSRYLSKSRSVGQRIPLPSVPGAPERERQGADGRGRSTGVRRDDEARLAFSRRRDASRRVRDVLPPPPGEFDLRHPCSARPESAASGVDRTQASDFRREKRTSAVPPIAAAPPRATRPSTSPPVTARPEPPTAGSFVAVSPSTSVPMVVEVVEVARATAPRGR